MKSTSDIPVAVQVYRAYPHVKELLEQRGFDVANYPPIPYEKIHNASPGGPEINLSPIPPIIVAEKTRRCFGQSSREHEEILQKTKSRGVYEFSLDFQCQYPCLADIISDSMNTDDTKKLEKEGLQD